MEDNKKSRAPIVLIITFVLVLVGLYAYLYLLPEIGSPSSKTMVVNYSTVQTFSENKCIVVREESVYTANQAGSVSYYSKEGEKTRRGTIVADVYSAANRQSLMAASTGVVSFYVDQYEEYFNPETFMSLDPKEVSELSDITPKSVENESAESGDPVFKLVTSDIWHIFIIASPEERAGLKPGQNITVEFDDGMRVPASISQVNDGENVSLILADIARYYEKSPQLRTVKAKIITSEISGFLIPSTAVTTNGENIGVYVLGINGEYTFKQIEVITEKDNETLIRDDGEVKLYDEVLKNAKNYK